MTRLRDNPQVAIRLAESSRWLFRRLMEFEAIKLEAAARELAKGGMMSKKKVDFEVLCCDRCGMTILEKGLIQTPEGVFCSKCLEDKQVLERKGE